MTTVDLSETERPRQSWWWPLLAWTAVLIVYAMVLSAQVRIPFRYAAGSAAIYVYGLAILSLPAQRFARQSLSGNWRPAALVAGHVIYGVVTVGLWFGVNVAAARLTVGPEFWSLVYADNWLFQLLSAMTAYGTVIGLTIAAAGFRRERERERREAALVLQARDAELGAIRAQFQPHFVLNALNSLLALIDLRPAEARTMVIRLADVMKEVFDRRNQPMVTMDRELKLVQAYLDVEGIRFGERLTVTFDVDADARAVLVPAFLLQPIVENAIKHGIAPFADAGRIQVRAARRAGTLTIDVRDSGKGPGTSPTGSGHGLDLTRRRLETTYGSRASIDLVHTP